MEEKDARNPVHEQAVLDFRLPARYAWKSENITDLFDDLRESIETRTRHYIGTFIFSKVGSGVAESVISGLLQHPPSAQTLPWDEAARKNAAANVYALVDGQQRLTTLSMVLHSLVAALPSNDDDRVFYERRFLRSRGVPNLLLQHNNHDFFYRLLQNTGETVPVTRGQRLLAKAHGDIKRQVQALVAQSGDQTLRQWLEGIKDLEVLEFVEEDEGRAIRIFQTVNDRGVPLTNMDKAKSLLVYYSNRFLDRKLDHKINECFGEAYRCYDALKELAESQDCYVDLIAREKFDEDSILRWHFVATKSERWTYDATAQNVLKTFLRRELKDRRDSPESLARFIDGYVTDVKNFFFSLQTTLERMKTDPSITSYSLFSACPPICIRSSSAWRSEGCWINRRGWNRSALSVRYLRLRIFESTRPVEPTLRWMLRLWRGMSWA